MSEEQFPIVELAIDFLIEDPSGQDQYVWCANGTEALASLLDAAFEIDTDPAPLIDELLRLTCALEGELRSPGAAAWLLTVLREDARVMAMIERPPPVEGPKVAPMYGAEAEAGTISLAALLDDRRSTVRDPREIAARSARARG